MANRIETLRAPRSADVVVVIQTWLDLERADWQVEIPGVLRLVDCPVQRDVPTYECLPLDNVAAHDGRQMLRLGAPQALPCRDAGLALAHRPSVEVSANGGPSPYPLSYKDGLCAVRSTSLTLGHIVETPTSDDEKQLDVYIDHEAGDELMHAVADRLREVYAQQGDKTRQSWEHSRKEIDKSQKKTSLLPPDEDEERAKRELEEGKRAAVAEYREWHKQGLTWQEAADKVKWRNNGRIARSTLNDWRKKYPSSV